MQNAQFFRSDFVFISSRGWFVVWFAPAVRGILKVKKPK
jgi:hypothetical protein